MEALKLTRRGRTEKMMPLLRPPKLDLNELARLQRRIAKRVRQRDEIGKLETIAGCDISFSRGNTAWAACAVLDYRSLDLIDHRAVKVKLRFPYIPTFLAFRELEGMLKAVAGVKADVYMVGAQGLAHPRRAGLACHFGVIIDEPTIGVAKSKLYGEAQMPSSGKGASAPLKEGDEVIGAVVRTRPNMKPVYVSVGHKVSLKTAVKITLGTTRDHRLPEPLHIAHELATKAMRG